MGKLRDLDIRFDYPSVYAGTLLRGQLCFHLKDVAKVRDIALWIEGQTKVMFTGETTGEKFLIRNELNLSPYLSTQSEYKSHSGYHQIPFAYPIPHNLPSSFGDKLGYVHYCCRVTINGQTKLSKTFNVIGIEDLNWHPYAALPVNIKETGSTSFWAFKKTSHNVTVLLQLERTGFLTGETIYINAEISNQSKRRVKQSAMQLKQGILYKSPNGRQKEVFKMIETISKGSIPPGSMGQWENEPLLVPQAPPSFMRGSELISTKYELVFTVDPGISMVIPVIIGTIPFHPENMKRIMKALPWKQCSELIKRKFSTDEDQLSYDEDVGREPQFLKIEEID